MNRRFSFPLVVHLSALFGFLIVATVAVLTWISYHRSVEVIAENGAQIAEKAANEIRLAIDAFFEPVELGVALVADNQINEETNWLGRIAERGIFELALDVDVPITSFYLGTRSGDFFMVRNLKTAAQRTAFGVNENVRYMIQSIDWENGEADGRFIYLDERMMILDSVDKPDYPKQFDPRIRPWYRKALVTIGIARTEPYVFSTTGSVGVTFAKSSTKADTVVGADLDLSELSALVQSQKPTPGSRVVLADHLNRVIASDSNSGYIAVNARGDPIQANVERFESLEIRAFSKIADSNRGLQSFEVGGEAYFGRKVSVDLRSGHPLTLFITIPEEELLAAAFETRRTMLILSAVVFIVALGLTLAAAYSISRSLVKLTDAAERFRQFDFETPLTDRSFIKEVRSLTHGFQALQRTLLRFENLIDLISRKKNLTALQPSILQELSAVLRAEKAILYVVPDQADELAVAAYMNGEDVTLIPRSDYQVAEVPTLVERKVDSGTRRARAGTITLEEMALPGLREMGPVETGFDDALCYPLLDRKKNVTGALLFLDCEKAGPGARALVGALTGIAAVSLETRQLIASEKQLFNAFITLIASAIDAKSAYTGGHCARVPELTKMLAEAAAEASEGPFRDFELDEDDWEAVHVASWLHDCGKVTSPEFVVDKATKLETIYDRIHEVRMRFEVLKRDAEVRRLEAIIAGEDPTKAQAARDAEWRQLDDDFAFVALCNEGGEFLGEDKIERLKAIATRTWRRTLDDSLGISQEERARKEATRGRHLPVEEPLLADRPDHIIARRETEIMPEDNPWGFKLKQPKHLYNRGELYNLAVSRGTLSDEERYKINDHIIQTIIMLSALPYPRHLRDVPELAGGHHEKMDGTGYPRRLKKDEMSPVARMMAVADIFEALTASDRPYKKAKTLSESIKIMSFMARDQHIDPDIFALFLTSGIYLDYAKRYMEPAMIDEVRIDDYLRSEAA